MSSFQSKVPYTGWTKSLIEFATFDTTPEFVAARALDNSSDLSWWYRNDPAKWTLLTLSGKFEPDFIYERNGGTRGILEIKAEFLWSAPGSEARVKSETACEWVAAQNEFSQENGGPMWEFATVIDADVAGTGHLDDLRSVAIISEP